MLLELESCSLLAFRVDVELAISSLELSLELMVLLLAVLRMELGVFFGRALTLVEGFVFLVFPFISSIVRERADNLEATLLGGP